MLAAKNVDLLSFPSELTNWKLRLFLPDLQNKHVVFFYLIRLITGKPPILASKLIGRASVTTNINTLAAKVDVSPR